MITADRPARAPASLFFHIHGKNTVLDRRKQYLPAICQRHHIHIICTGLQHITDSPKYCAIFLFHRHPDQICNKILIFFSFTAFSLVTYRFFFTNFSISLIPSYPLNFRITNCLKNLTVSTSRSSLLRPRSRIRLIPF